MKNLIAFLFFVGISFYSYSQDKLMEILPLKDGIVTYSSVIPVNETPKDELYSRAKKWFASTYKSSNDVIQLDDKEKGEILGKGNFKIVYYAREPIVSHTVTISVKDNRFKYVISSIAYSDKQGDKFPIEEFPKGWFGKKKLYETINSEIKALITSIEKAMNSKEEEW
jgi:Domain of unknown function (DUF4468) with TBP-like fold